LFSHDGVEVPGCELFAQEAFDVGDPGVADPVAGQEHFVR
jgi:hypothetical protein